MTIIVLLPYAVSAQQQLPSFAPTPTAASIARFGDVPVSPFTGLPSISIPLYSFNVVGLELPLRLDYVTRGRFFCHDIAPELLHRSRILTKFANKLCVLFPAKG